MPTFAANPRRAPLLRTVWFLLFAVIVHPAPSVAAESVSCAVSPLKKLMVTDRKGFDVRKGPLNDHSTEGGTLTILSRKATPQRARAELFGETGKVTINLGHLNGDLMAIVQRTEYAEPLPKTPVRIRKVETLTGFVCSGILILDRQDSGDIGKDKISEFERLTTWLLDELKSRGVQWSVRLPSEK